MHLAPFALELAEAYLGDREIMLCKLLVRFYGLLNEEGRFLSAEAKVELPELGLSLCSLYTVLAQESAMAGKKNWKGMPKLHLFQHTVVHSVLHLCTVVHTAVHTAVQTCVQFRTFCLHNCSHLCTVVVTVVH